MKSNAQTLHAAISQAAAIAPETCPYGAYRARKFEARLPHHGAPYGFEYIFFTDETYLERKENHGSAISAIQAQTISELLHTIEHPCTPEFITFKTSERGTMKVRNVRARLEKFAGTVKANQALFGGGIKPTPRTKPAQVWPMGVVKIACEMLQDLDFYGAYDLATQKCGALFYTHKYGTFCPFMLLAPVDCAEIAGMHSAKHEGGWFEVFEKLSGRILGTGRTRAGAIAKAVSKWEGMTPQNQKTTFEHCHSAPVDQDTARALWLEKYGITAPIEAQELHAAHAWAQSEAAAQDVVSVVASAMAGAAIEAANESAALADVAEISAATYKDTSAHDVATIAAELVTTAKYAGTANARTLGTQGHAASIVQSTQPKETKHQRVFAKSGNWSANLYTDTLGRTDLVFIDQHGTHDPQHFETGRERIRALQTMARRADTQAPGTAPSSAPTDYTAPRKTSARRAHRQLKPTMTPRASMMPP